MTRSFRLVCATGVLLAAVAAHVPAAVAASDDPGRLFYTPAERAQLEQARARKLTRLPSSAGAAASGPQRYDGVVIRSDGRATHWVDGRPQPQGVGGLKPGQVRADGQVYEPYQVTKPQPPSPTPRNPAPAAAP